MNFVSFSVTIIYYFDMGKFVFGPVPSRRLGFSLGVDIVPKKYCSFDCIYCQVGKTTNHVVQRKSFFDPDAIVKEVIEQSKNQDGIDFITFSGSGEPTLNTDIGRMINEIKGKTDIPLSVITNSSLLKDDKVKDDLKEADVVLPSLDAASEDIFRYINRPHSLIELDMIIESLKEFRSGYKGKIWLEIMLLKNINDEMEEITKLKEIIEYISVDKVHLNTVTRPPSHDTAKVVERAELNKIREFIGTNCEVVCSFKKSDAMKKEEDWLELLPEILRRRSLTLDDILKITGLSTDKTKERLNVLENQKKIKSFCFGDSIYYMADD